MKKNKNRSAGNSRRYWILFTLSSIFLLSCEKFVDIKTSNSIRLIESVDDCQLILNHYNNMNVGYPSDGESSADDYYLDEQNGYLSENLTETDRDIYIWSRNAIREMALPQWQKPYYVIYLSNLVLESVDKLGGTVNSEINDDIKGQALFFRAYAYWNLAQLYAPTYNPATSSQDLGIPLRLKSDINGESTRGTVEQIYSQIIKDLSDASTLLANTSAIASRPNKVAAFGMLAKVYLSMDRYADALNNASLALAGRSTLIDYNTIDSLSETPFNRFNDEVIFQATMTINPTLLANSGSDNMARIDSLLVRSYDSNDLRGKIFFKANTDSNVGSFRFSGNYEPSTSSLFCGIAVDELFLIRAECYARTNNTNSAMSDLNTLLRFRWTDGKFVSFTAANSTEALRLILIERRKELVMRGLRWTDLRRLNKDPQFAKTLYRNILGTSYSLPPNDLRYTLLIPQEVINNSSIQQNPR
jgi:hypothetical protein